MKVSLTSTIQRNMTTNGRVRTHQSTSGGSIGRTVWKWSGKSRFSGAFPALLVNLRRFIFLPDLLPLGLRG